MSLNGKIAIVTGSARGIGLAIAERFAKEGAITIVSDIRGEEEAAAGLRAAGYDAHAIAADVSSDASVQSLVDQVFARFGGVHILVNNAAMASELRPEPFEEQDTELWKRIYDVNVIGAFRACRAVAPYMRAQKWGRIVNIASGTAFKGAPGMMHYIASKGAIIAMTRSLANELGGDNILCNTIAPGFTMTESLRGSSPIADVFASVAIQSRAIKREEHPVDVANAIYFLASEDSGFITGQTLVVDGGSVFN